MNFLLPFSLDETTKTYATSLVSFTKALEACGNEYVGECLKKTIIMGECLRIVENNVGSWESSFLSSSVDLGIQKMKNIVKIGLSGCAAS